MRTFEIKYMDGGEEGSHFIKAINRGSARAAFRVKFGSAKVLSMSEVLTPTQKVIQEALVDNTLKFGVQKSLQMGYKDLPLFREDNQLELF